MRIKLFSFYLQSDIAKFRAFTEGIQSGQNLKIQIVYDYKRVTNKETTGMQIPYRMTYKRRMGFILEYIAAS